MKDLGRTENVKQVEYLSDIRDVGMSIVFGECDADAFSSRFEKYLDYVEKPSEYLQTVKKVYNMILKEECTPDDLLLIMGKYTKTIEYEEPEVEYSLPIDEFDDDDDDDIECIELSDDATEVLLKILNKLSEE